jgi:hypothetical protein
MVIFIMCIGENFGHIHTLLEAHLNCDNIFFNTYDLFVVIIL